LVNHALADDSRKELIVYMGAGTTFSPDRSGSPVVGARPSDRSVDALASFLARQRCRPRQGASIVATASGELDFVAAIPRTAPTRELRVPSRSPHP
jgi:hypothetical protein